MLQRRKTLGDLTLARVNRCLVDDLNNPLPAHSAATEVGDRPGVRIERTSSAAQAVDVQLPLGDEIRTHLHHADASLRLGIGDAEAAAVGIVEAKVPELEITQLAGAYPAEPQRRDDHAAAHIRAGDGQAKTACVVADRGLRDSERFGDLKRTHPLVRAARRLLVAVDLLPRWLCGTGRRWSWVPAASSAATSSSISRNVRVGSGTLIFMRRDRAGFVLRCSSSIASSRIAMSVLMSFLTEARRAGAPACWSVDLGDRLLGLRRHGARRLPSACVP